MPFSQLCGQEIKAFLYVFFTVLFCLMIAAVILMSVRYHRHDYLTPPKVSSNFHIITVK